MYIDQVDGRVPLDVSKPSFVAYHIMRSDMLRRQNESDLQKDYIGVKSWLKEYGTLKFSMGRQQGTTTIIDYNCMLYPETTLVIVHKTYVAQHMDHVKYHAHHLMPFDNYFQRFRGTNQKFDYVFVDCAEFMKKKQIDKMYDAIVKYHPEVKLISMMQ